MEFGDCQSFQQFNYINKLNLCNNSFLPFKNLQIVLASYTCESEYFLLYYFPFIKKKQNTQLSYKIKKASW